MLPNTVNLTPAQVSAGLGDDSIVLVDVREPNEYEAGHIPGSVNLPLSTFDVSALPFEDGKTMVLSCQAGVRSQRAMDYARAQGADASHHLAGGFSAWVNAGLPVER